jgi:hypothetical protein
MDDSLMILNNYFFIDLALKMQFCQSMGNVFKVEDGCWWNRIRNSDRISLKYY